MEKTSNLRDLFKFLASVKGDLANITAPPHFLAQSSFLETGACWTERPRLFSAPTSSADPAKRCFLILRWWLCSLKRQFYIAGGPGVGIKKPLNAFLGEVFQASWEDATGVCRYVAEQVSHHPPITAVYMWDEAHGISGQGYSRVEMTFANGVSMRQYGHLVVHIDEYDEDYLIPAPAVAVKGFLSGKLYPEINGTYSIESSSGFVSEMRFSGQGFLGGERNKVDAIIYRRGDSSKRPLFSVSGHWSGILTFRDCATGEVIETFNTNAKENAGVDIHIDDVEQQDPWESRRAWKNVISALRCGEMGKTIDEKSKIENAQRKMRVEETKNRQVWRPLVFSPLQGGYKLFDQLGVPNGWALEDYKTKGVWKVDVEFARTLRHKRPYRGSLLPTGPGPENEA